MYNALVGVPASVGFICRFFLWHGRQQGQQELDRSGYYQKL